MKSALWRIQICCTLLCILAGSSVCGQSLPATQPSRVESLGEIPHPNSRLLRASISRDGSRVLCNFDQRAAQRDIVTVHDVATGEQLLRRETTGPQTTALRGEAISADGKRITVSWFDAKLRTFRSVIEVDTGQAIWESETGPGDSAFLGDGNRVLVSYLKPDSFPRSVRKLRTVELPSAKVISDIEVPNIISPIRPSQDGERLLGSRDAQPRLACVFDLAKQSTLPDLEGSVMRRFTDCVEFLAGTDEVVGLIDGKLLRWDAATGKIRKEVGAVEPLGHEDFAHFAPDGRRLYLRVGNELIVRDSVTGRLLHRMMVAPGTELMTVSDNGVAGLRFARLLRFVRVPVESAVQ